MSDLMIFIQQIENIDGTGPATRAWAASAKSAVFAELLDLGYELQALPKEIQAQYRETLLQWIPYMSAGGESFPVSVRLAQHLEQILPRRAWRELEQMLDTSLSSSVGLTE